MLVEVGKQVLLAVACASYGVLAAAGVFTIFVVIGLLPRFAGRTNTAAYIMRYENAVIYGTLAGTVLTVFDGGWEIGARWQEFCMRNWPEGMNIGNYLGQAFLGIAGIFAGIFIGCLALAIAEMVDSIPIFTRRISFEKGISLSILGIALGKLCGSLIYFFWGFYGV
ncbi:MAG: stage V sporulation protein AB [Lachnospiraceae bacterium]|nr:stage V sporulation protein AB [Lachnospiraceae bacterium]